MLTTRGFIVTLMTTSVISALGGGALTYVITKNLLAKQYEQQIQEEMAEARRFYAKRYKTDEYSTPESTVKEYAKKLSTFDYTEGFHKVEKKTTTAETTTRVEEELHVDEDDAPYIITQEDFLINEKDYRQITITFFEDDNVLCDDHEKPMTDADTVVGYQNLKFGLKSSDNNIVYVRNDVLCIDFEVVRNQGNYASIVLGFTHSDAKRPRKFRRDHE